MPTTNIVKCRWSHQRELCPEVVIYLGCLQKVRIGENSPYQTNTQYI
jgi:hypothetical protein